MLIESNYWDKLKTVGVRAQQAGRLPAWIDWEGVTPETPLETLGFDSLGRIHFLNAIEVEFQCSLSEARAAKAHSLGHLLELVREHGGL